MYTIQKFDSEKGRFIVISGDQKYLDFISIGSHLDENKGKYMKHWVVSKRIFLLGCLF